MITADQVKDLQPGDVVELFRNSWPDGTVVRGALYEASGWLYVAEEAVRGESGRAVLGASYSLTVISRAPRPLYVNSDKTEPDSGDVVRDADDDNPDCWDYIGPDGKGWGTVGQIGWHTRCVRDQLPARLRLLVDGRTGQVVR